MDKVCPWQSDLIMEVEKFSLFLLQHEKIKQQPELIALAFWCRKANLFTIKQEYQQLCAEAPRSAVKRVFHIAPANVDTVFFYSLLLSTLSGNQNIIRISERSGEVCHLLIHLFKEFLVKSKLNYLNTLTSIVEYSSQNTLATSAFSGWSSLRVIWGGDLAISEISAIEPQTPQLSFPDRYSIAVCQLIDSDNIEQISKNFITDFLPFNQQACSSPKALFWLNTTKALQKKFYLYLLSNIESGNNQLSSAEQIERQINMQKLLMLKNNEIIDKQDSSQVMILALKQVTQKLLTQHNGNGLLLVKEINKLNELPYHDKLQTVCYWGLSADNTNEILANNCKRLTSFGQALTFNHVWDGVNLLQALTKSKCRYLT